MPVVSYQLPVASCQLSVVSCQLSVNRFSFFTAHCPLPTAHCPLPTAHCPLPTPPTATLKYPCAMDGFDGQMLALGLIWYLAFLLSITVHEAAHAWSAWRLGDSTAYRGGQVTLNPLPHIQREPLGTVIVPIVSFFLAGWMLGWASAPYDPHWAARFPRRAAWMALAGPASNVVLAIAAGLAMRVGVGLGWLVPSGSGFDAVVQASSQGGWGAIAAFLSILFSLNLLLAVFNILPLPPMDGHAVLPLFLPSSWAAVYSDWMRQPIFGWVGIVAAWNLIGYIFIPAWRAAVLLFLG